LPRRSSWSWRPSGWGSPAQGLALPHRRPGGTARRPVRSLAGVLRRDRVTRESLAAFEGRGRLVYVSAALVLPLIAGGAEELARRRTILGAGALVPLAVGLPGNLDQLSETSIMFRANRELAHAIAHSPFVDDVPGSVRPMQDHEFLPPPTADWLARQAAAGASPRPTIRRQSSASRRRAGWS
jgi:hypothetical protein